MTVPSALQPLDTTTAVETPEHVRFRYQIAGPARRFFAYLVDLIVRGAILLALAMVAGIAGLAVGGVLDASMGFLLVVAFFVEWFYYVLWEVIWSGRSPGKRALRLRVLSDTGHPLRFGQSLLRNLLRAADFLPSMYALGVIVMGRDDKFRRLGDLVAGTMVVVEDRANVGGPLQIYPPPSAKELASLPHRIPISGEEIEALELFLRREDRLPPLRSFELAEMVAPIFGKRIGITRIQDPVRFLKVLYARTRGLPAGPEMPQQQPPRPVFALYGAPGWALPGWAHQMPPQGWGPQGWGPQGWGPPHGPGWGPGGSQPPGWGAGWGGSPPAPPPGWGGPSPWRRS